MAGLSLEIMVPKLFSAALVLFLQCVCVCVYIFVYISVYIAVGLDGL